MQPRRRLSAVLMLAIVTAFPACGSPQSATSTPTAAPTRVPTSASTPVLALPLILPLTPTSSMDATATVRSATVAVLSTTFSATNGAIATTESATKSAIATQASLLPRADTLPPCRATDLIARWDDSAAGLPGGKIWGSIALANVSTGSCVLEGTPTLLYFDAAHATMMHPEIPCQSMSDYLCAEHPVVLTPTSGLPPRYFPSDMPGTEAFIPVFWVLYQSVYASCGLPTQTKPAEIWVRLPNDGGDLPLQEPFFGKRYAGESSCNDTINVYPIAANWS